MIQYVHGDVVAAAKTARVDVIVHGCNIFCKMGNGIALQIKNEFPNAYAVDTTTTKGDRSKLGTYTSAYIQEYNLTVVNAYTQATFWDVDDMLSYSAISRCMHRINSDFKNCTIAMPKIGAGLACGDWNQISIIIEDAFKDRDVLIYYL